MNEEYIYVKTNDVQKDMHDFVNQFGDEIEYISYPKNIIRLKNDIIYRFTYTLVGIRKYYSYTEVYNYHLKFQNKNLQQENQKLKSKLEASEKARIEAIEFINGAGEMASYTKSIVMYGEEIEELLEILDIDKGE